MTELTAELPLHNIGENQFIEGTGFAEIVGGSECLATRSTDSYVRFPQTAATGEVGIRVEDEFGNQDSSVTGFGLWTPPDLAEVTDIRFIAEGFIESGAIAVDEATWDDVQGGGVTNDPRVTHPMILIGYGGDPWSFGGYNISTFPVGTVGPAECAVELNHLLSGSDYVIAGIGTPSNGEAGLQPRVFVPQYPFPATTCTLVLTYLAIRITYTVPEASGIADLETRRLFFPT